MSSSMVVDRQDNAGSGDITSEVGLCDHLPPYPQLARTTRRFDDENYRVVARAAGARADQGRAAAA
jgi:hypothetical protein